MQPLQRSWQQQHKYTICNRILSRVDDQDRSYGLENSAGKIEEDINGFGDTRPDIFVNSYYLKSQQF